MRKRILIVEDDASIGEILQMMLEDAGYLVDLKTDGHGVQQMQKPFPELLFLDIRLSGMDGRALCRQLKQQEATRHIPIILLSAYEDLQAMGKATGADGFLAKPFAMKDLLTLVAHYLGRGEEQ